VVEESLEALLGGGRREPALCAPRFLPPSAPPSRSVYSAAAWLGLGSGLGSGLGLRLGLGGPWLGSPSGRLHLQPE